MSSEHRERPVASSAEVSARMRAQFRSDTAPEAALRRVLFERGLRYRLQYPIMGTRRTIDIAFPRTRVAVFVDGCFWHSCPEHATLPKANSDWWARKLLTNRERDIDTDRRLGEAGWTVIRVWEHEDPNVAADRVERAVLGA